MGPIPKKHHVIPQVYLKNFVDDDGRLSVWSKRRGNSHRPLPKDALVRRHYYSQPLNGIENADQTIETSALHSIETEYPMLYKWFLDGFAGINAEIVDLFVQTLLSFRSRSPAFREAYEIGLADMVKRHFDSLPDRVLPTPPKGHEDIRDRVQVTIDPHRSITGMATYILNYLPILNEFEYTVRFSERCILTSDNPVVWYETGYGSGIPEIYPQRTTKKTRVLIPISKNHVLVGRPVGSLDFRPGLSRLSDRLRKELNETQLACAWDEVVGIPQLSRNSMQRYSDLAPSMQISWFDPESNDFYLEATNLSTIKEKAKYNFPSSAKNT